MPKSPFNFLPTGKSNRAGRRNGGQSGRKQTTTGPRRGGPPGSRSPGPGRRPRPSRAQQQVVNEVVNTPEISFQGAYSIADTRRAVDMLERPSPGLPINALGLVPTIIPLTVGAGVLSLGRGDNRWLNDVGTAPDFGSYLSATARVMGAFYSRQTASIAGGVASIEVNNTIGDIAMPGLIVTVTPPEAPVIGVDESINFAVSGVSAATGAVISNINFRWEGSGQRTTKFLLLFGQPNANEGQRGYPDALLSRLAASANRLTVAIAGSDGFTIGVRTFDRSANEFDWLRNIGVSPDLVNPNLFSQE